MEAFTLRAGTQGGMTTGGGMREPSDERLVQLLRDGDEGAFEAIVSRYRSRLFGFCRRMLGSTEDAEDVLQEVLANAYRAMLADEREINLKPWLFRIARNRCLNHLQRIRPIPEAQERLERIPTPDAAATHERVQNREEFRQLLGDLRGLPESQRQALLLCELDGLSYEQVGAEMTTTVPAIRSLLTRARTTLAETSQARELTCADVQIQLGEAALDGATVPRPVRRHLNNCAPCCAYRDELGADAKALASFSPIGLLIAAKELLFSKLGGGAGAAAGGGSTAAAGAVGAGGGLVSGLGAAGWATNAKLAAATLAVAAAAGGAEHLAAPADSGQLQRIAPVLKTAPQSSPIVQTDPGEASSSEAAAPPSLPFDRSTIPDPALETESPPVSSPATADTQPEATAFGDEAQEPGASVAAPATTDEVIRP